jgi:hydrogenase maturation protein HypF
MMEAMPYDRAATTMGAFAMCTVCSNEYSIPADRRFHSQTNACPECGPQVRLVDSSGQTLYGNQAIDAAIATLRNGHIVALKGVGGYQLLADATRADAVCRLRDRKQRKTKPLAVLVESLEAAERLTRLSEAELRLMLDPAGPIVVVRRRDENLIASNVAPGFNSIGLMLPTTPLHGIISARFGHPLVCTSGNREGEPLVYEDGHAELELRGITDVWLHHDRRIIRPIDDSVVRVIAGSTCFLRLARGYAPHVLPLPQGRLEGPVVALGGEQKTAIAIWNGAQAVLGPHVGDLTNAAACRRWDEQLESLVALYGVELESAEIIHDRHPDYFSSGWAQRYRRRQTVQHHHAHIAAVLLEHGALDREVLGLSWDGTGYGDDGTIWGGECLRATAGKYRRVARLLPFPLVGGERAIREPWRVAAALVVVSLGVDAIRRLDWPEVLPSQLSAVIDVLKRPRLCPFTSSMGRLFDGVAALALRVSAGDDEGRPAMLLEEACTRDEQGAYAFEYHVETGAIDWRPVIAAVVKDVRSGASPGVVAMRFHRGVADLVGSLSEAHANLPLVTAGGVFQNAVLGDLLVERFTSRRTSLLRGQSVPPGDGGLAAGQLAVAAGRTLRTTARS